MTKTSEEITEFLNKAGAIERRSSGNARGGMFARAARQLIVGVYQMSWETKIWTAREGKDTSKADKLMSMSIEEAIYGVGRDLLSK